MTRRAPFLAALASAALPGLDPVLVQAATGRDGDEVDTAFVRDSKDRDWVVRAPRTAAAGALLEDAREVTALLRRRLDIPVPAAEGSVAVPEGRALVHRLIDGLPLAPGGLVAGSPVAEALGHAIAHVHNLEPELFEDVGRPAYDTQACRARRRTELARAEATGLVPQALLVRWGRMVDEDEWWKFAPVPVHGSLRGSSVLVGLAAGTLDGQEPGSGPLVRGLLGWEHSHVGDPAEDFAPLVQEASEDAVATVLAAYGPSRVVTPDAHLLDRARLLAETADVRRLLEALASGQDVLVAAAAQRLRDLETFTSGRPHPLDVVPEPEPEATPEPEPAATGSVPVPARRESTAHEETQAITTRPAGEAGAAEAGPGEAAAAGSGAAGPGEAAEADPAEAGPTAEAGTAATAEGTSDGGTDDPTDEETAPATLPPRGPRQTSPHDATQLIGTRSPDLGDDAAEREPAEREPREDDEGDGAVLDLHEGASEFVPVAPRRPRPQAPDGDDDARS